MQIGGKLSEDGLTKETAIDISVEAAGEVLPVIFEKQMKRFNPDDKQKNYIYQTIFNEATKRTESNIEENIKENRNDN